VLEITSNKPFTPNIETNKLHLRRTIIARNTYACGSIIYKGLVLSNKIDTLITKT
jgi:hypothetical protein